MRTSPGVSLEAAAAKERARSSLRASIRADEVRETRASARRRAREMLHEVSPLIEVAGSPRPRRDLEERLDEQIDLALAGVRGVCAR